MSIALKIGCDPELFLSLNNKYISASGILPGTKAEPFKVEKGAVQVDGLAFEFNIDPAETAEEFDKNIDTVLKQMHEMVAKIDKDIKLKFSPIARFDDEYFKKLTPDVKVLGCDPDFTCDKGEISIKYEDITNVPIRTAAGHVHVGWTEGEDAMSPAHFEDCRYIAKHMFNNDHKVGFHPKTDAEYLRLKYYGAHGAFRPKSYGVELRSYSNLWVEKSVNRQKMFNYVTREVKNLYKGS